MSNVFVLHWNGSGPKGCLVARFTDRATAETWAQEGLPGDYTGHVVERIGDFDDKLRFPTATLVALYNALAKTDITKFDYVDHGKERILRVLVERFGAELRQ